MNATETKFSTLYKNSPVFSLIQKEKDLGMELSTDFITNLANNLMPDRDEEIRVAVMLELHV